MPWGYAASAVGSYLATKGKSGGGGGGGGSAYVPQDQKGADTNFLDNKNNYQNLLTQQQATTSPINEGLLQQQINNPFDPMAQGYSNYAAGQYANASNMANIGTGRAWTATGDAYNNAIRSQDMVEAGRPNMNNAVNTMYGMAGQSNQNFQGLMDYQKGQLGNIQNSQANLYGAGNQVLQTSQDPQNALYNRTQQQLTDQSRAGQYARGIQSSPYGAALENSANENFNIDWQNQQLARQAQGLQSAQGAYGSAQGMGNAYTGAQAGLQGNKNEQYAGLTNAAQKQYVDYLNASNQASMMNTQNIGMSNQNAMTLAQGGAQSAYNAGQVPYMTNQNRMTNQNQAIQNYTGNNSTYLQGLNQLQSNDLGYMNNAQGAQNQAFQQNAYNNQQTQQAIGSIAGPVMNGLQNANWGKIGNTVGGWFGSGNSGGSSSGGGDTPSWADWGYSG